MRILYLYSELGPYQIPVFEEFVGRYNADVQVVHWDHKKLKPYIPQSSRNVTYHSRSQLNRTQLLQLATGFGPDIAYVSGWQDCDYLYVARDLRRLGVPVVTGFDDQWRGTLKQHVGSTVAPYVLKRYFSHCWVAGPYQYEYAQRMGFRKSSIVFNLLSGNTRLFGEAMIHLTSKSVTYPEQFLYVGNFRAVKGTDILARAYGEYRARLKGHWTLMCVGNGELQGMLASTPGVRVSAFAGQERLVEASKLSGAFILPSRLDQWGVVVHEFAAAGMPLILSENVGARATFLIDGFNGVSYGANSASALAEAMNWVSSRSAAELVAMGERSHLLSKRISAEISAASFVSVLDSQRRAMTSSCRP